MNRYCPTIFTLTTALLLTACAGMGKPPEEVVAQRAQERLDLIVADDLAGAYEYLSPGYRSGVSLADYQRRLLSRPGRWNDAVVGKTECAEDACKVRVSVDYTVHGVLPGVSRFDTKAGSVEDWVKLDGTWYHVPGN